MLQEIILLLGGLILTGFIIILTIFIYGIQQSKQVTTTDTTHKVTIIIPCKGADRHLKKNLQAFCLQTYANYEILFIVDSTEDPAYPLLQQITKNTTNTTIKLTKKNPQSSGKIAALLTGIHHAKETDILVFADADIRPHSSWLAYLTAPLHNQTVGATTGFRWFFPHSLKTYLLSAWNMGSIISLFHPLSNYTWGGSTAITKKLFDQLKIETYWKTGLSDDLILTKRLKKAKKTIHFIPQCILHSPQDSSLSSFLSWGTQQFTWIRWYNQKLWMLSLFSMLFLHLMLIVGIIELMHQYYIIALVLLSPLLLEMIYGLTAFLSLRSQMQYTQKKFGSVVPYAIFMPLVFVLFTFNLLSSAVRNNIIWHGKTYTKKQVTNR